MINRVLRTLCILYIFVCASPVLATHWTESTSDEDGKDSKAICENSVATGLKCKGRYCDNVSLGCSEGLATQTNQWSPSFSEEDKDGYVCPNGEFVQGLRCEGKFCDNVAVQCARTPELETKSCEWRAGISEENGGTLEFGQGVYLKGLKCQGKYCDRLEPYVCKTEEVVCESEECKFEQAKKFAPVLKFDKSQADSKKCFPSDPGPYWDARKDGDKSVICNEDPDSLSGGQIPIYYQYQDCSADSTVIMYWFFYGYQDTCSPGLGSHHADWERVAVRIKNGKLQHVKYYQHKGNYTKKPENIQFFEGTHPVAFVGKNSHGSYHDDGGSGSCLYFEDYRNPGKKPYVLQTKENLVPLHRGPGAPEWMTAKDSKNFDGIPSPLARNINICAMEGCMGKDVKIGSALCFGTCGCSKSDIGDSPF